MNLLSELRRRNVPRMALLYLGAAWLVMQVVDVLIDRGPLPESLGPIALIVLAIGFPIALLLSWFYEVTPEGVVLDDEVLPGTATPGAGRRMDFVVIAVLASAVLLFAFDKWWVPEPPERSVAVLPFVNVSADEESDYVAVGIADTILTVLAQVPELHVAARTSSFQPQLKGREVAEIAAMLGVSTVLEGTVQRQGDRLRISAQLVDAEQGGYLWSASFDRSFDDLFAIQDEIATAATVALNKTLGSETRKRIALQDTDDIDAYNEFMLGVHAQRTGTTEALRRAEEHFKAALAIDPGFARAWTGLASLYLHMNGWGMMSLPEAAEPAQAALSKALALAPQYAEALGVASYLQLQLGNEDEARRLMQQTLALDDRNLDAIYVNSRLLMRQPEERIAVLQRLVKLDPLSGGNRYSLVNTLVNVGRVEEGAEVAQHFFEIDPRPVSYTTLARALDAQGRYARLIGLAHEMLFLDSQDPDTYWALGQAYAKIDLPERARFWFEKGIALDPNHRATATLPLFISYYIDDDPEASFELARGLLGKGVVNDFVLQVLTETGARLGRHDDVLASLEQIFPALFDNPGESNGPGFAYHYVGYALMNSGDRERGLLLIKRATDELASIERTGYFVFLSASVMVRSIVGDQEGATEQLRRVARHKFLVDPFTLRRSIQFDAIREEPDFIALMQAYEANAAVQRDILKSMELPNLDEIIGAQGET